MHDKSEGFIHKQIDLPYSYNLKSRKASENKGFKKQFLQLIADLENRNPEIANKHVTDPIDKNRKGPQGQTIYVGINGGRYYMNSLGTMTYINIHDPQYLNDNLQNQRILNSHQKIADPIDKSLKGPSGQTVFMSPRGGRYYLGPVGQKVYLKAIT